MARLYYRTLVRVSSLLARKQALSIPNELREFDRTAVLTIQGGGVYGLSLLGQVGAVVNRLEIEPLALAGTSAGAIVATLLWAGYRPKDIRQKFINLTRPGSVPSLIDLLGPFEPQAAPFDWTAFQKLDEESRKVWGVIKSANELVGEKTNIFVRGFKAPGRLKQAWQAKNLIVRFARDNQVHVNNRGIFRGKQLEDRIDDWLRSATRLRAYAAKLPRDRPLSFGDIHDVAKKNPEATFVPLFLAATNLSARVSRRTVLLSSRQDRAGSERRLVRRRRCHLQLPGLGLLA